ncbi:hypothetical protein [Novosphingobium sp. B-7]|uniref:hypothetical protein n=1 Tax=Novosphingobium sp. B-7 TaxID=1298855 RepID=UPI0011D26440|nr:hypothetical protein [Novosphingobium sp. B-7]
MSTAPAGAVASAPVSQAMPAASLPQPLRDAASGPMSQAAPDLLDDPGALADGLADETWRQVRIEQRLIIRITPGIMGRDMPPPPPMPQPMMVLRGRHGGGCVALGGIAAIAPSSSDSQIVLLLRDRRQVVASLEKTCNARDFYVGFYAERSSDGMLCTGRDVIHSRAGASCMITRLREVGR